MMESKKEPFSLSKRALSFRYAINGIICLLKNEHNAWIHIVALIGVISAGLFFGITTTEWVFITIVSSLVLLCEGFNTAIEYLANFVSPEHHILIGKVKDIAAGSVLIAAIAAAITGFLIFTPYIFM